MKCIWLVVVLVFGGCNIAEASPPKAFECGVIDCKPDNRNYAKQPTMRLNVGDPRTVRLIYFLPNDRPYRAEVVQRMKDEILSIQAFYAEAMQAHGYDMTFKIETDTQDEVIIHRVDGKHDDLHYIDNTSETVRAEVREVFDVTRNIYFIVTDNQFDRIGRGVGKIRANADATRYGKNGGTALIPAYHFRRRIRNDNFGYDKLSAHEIGHAFGLQHDFRSGGYIMSYGAGLNRALIGGPDQDRLSKCNADQLSVHTYFNLNILTESGVPPTIDLISPDTYPAGADSINIKVKATDSEGIHQVILFVKSVGFFSPVGFPEVKAYHKLIGKKEAIVNFEYDGDVPGSSFTKLSRSTQHNIHIAAIDINGDISSSIFTFLEKSTGQADDSKEGLKVIRGKQEASNNSSYQTLNLPVGARVRIGKGRANHTANKAAAFSPDGQYLAVASSIGIWLYDTVNYQEVALLSSQYPIANIVFSPDGSIVVGTSRHGRIQNHVWSIITKEKIATFRDPIGGSVGAIAFSTNGKTIASASANRLILWDVETAQELIRIKCQNFINTLSFSHDGDMIASGESDGLIRLWDALTGQLIGAFRHDPYVSSIAFSPTEYILASCSTREGTIKLWNVATETETLTIKNKRGTSVVAFSPDGKTLAWCDIFDTINLWNVATQSLVAVYDDLTNLNINSIALSPNGKTFVSVDGHYDIVKVWDMITGNTIDLGHVGLTPISFSFDNSMLVSGGRRGVKLWNVNTGENVAIIPVKHKSRVRLVLFSPENITLAYRVSGEKFTRLWDVNKKTQIGVIQNPSIECWTFSPDGKTLASGAGRLITLWDVETKQENFTLEGHLDRIEHLTFSPDGSTLASKSGIMHSAIKLWDIKTKQNTDSFETDDPFKVFSRPVFSPDNTMLVFSRSNDGIKVWNLVTREMTDINSEDDFLTFLPNSSMMILKSYTHEYGEKVSVWNAKTATHITTLDPVIFEYWKQLIFSPDGETLAIAGQDSVTLFDPKVIYNQLPAAAPASINIVNAKQTELLSNYPNPFNPETWIPYRLAEDANVTLTIYDIEGREIKAIHIGHRKAGHYVSRNKAIYWDGTNDLGESVASGLYFYQLQADDYSETKRMLVLK